MRDNPTGCPEGSSWHAVTSEGGPSFFATKTYIRDFDRDMHLLISYGMSGRGFAMSWKEHTERYL